MKQTKRLVSCLLALVLLLSLLPRLPLPASAATLSGVCGDDLQWTLDTGTHVLTITGSGAMWDYTGPTYDLLPGWITAHQQPSSVVLPQGLTRIGSRAFYYCRGLTEITIPESVTAIGESAFEGCSMLESVTVPGSVRTIENSAFQDCESLKRAVICDGVQNIGEQAFAQCDGLVSVVIAGSVQSVGTSAFASCFGLKSAELQTGVREIGDGAFSGCRELRTLTIPETVTSIGEYAFCGCEWLKSVTLPEELQRIGADAFYGCTALTGISIPAGVSSIGDGAFRHCYRIRELPVAQENRAYCSVDGVLFNRAKTRLIQYPGGKTGSYTVPDSVTQIAPYAFAGCVELTDLTVPDSVTDVGNNAFENSSFTTLTLSARVTKIPDEAFTCCRALQSVTIPDGVTRIGKFAFSECDVMESVTLPASVQSIDEGAFFSCPTLKDVYYGGSAAAWERISIGDANRNLLEAELHCDPNAPEPEPFCESVYRVDRLAQDTPEAAAYRAFSIGKTPCEILYEDIRDSEFADWEKRWKNLSSGFDLVSDLPAELEKRKFGQKDLYSALLLSALGSYAESEMMNAVKKAANDANKLSSEAKEIRELAYFFTQAGKSEFRNYTPAQKLQLKSVLEGHYELVEAPKAKLLNTLGEGFELADVFFDGANTVDDFFEQVAAYIRVRELAESMQTAVREMYDCAVSSGASWYVQAALQDCVEVMAASVEEFENELLTERAYLAGGRFAVRTLAGKLWDKLVSTAGSSFPPLAVLLTAYKSGKLVSNLAFSTDALTECHLKLLAVLDLEELALMTTNRLWARYSAEPGEDAAAALLDAIRLRFRLSYVDCDAADEFCKTVDSAAWSRLQRLFSQEDASYTDLHLAIQRIKADREEKLASIETAWITGLQRDYPELYEYYSAQLEAEDSSPAVREYQICCPVDVFVYDAEERLVASASGGRIAAEGKLSVSLSGTEKNVVFYDDGLYRIECRGYDEGTMNLRVNEFAEDGETLRSAGLYALPVSDGATYSTLTGQKPADAEPYTVTSGAQTLPADFDSLTGGQELSVSLVGGFLSYLGTSVTSAVVCPNAAVGLRAIAPAGYAFAGWTADSAEVAFEDASAPETVARIGADCVIRADFVPRPDADVCPGESDEGYYVEAVVPPSCTENGYTSHTCTLCGERFLDSFTQATGHSFGEASWVTEPTCTEDGLLRSVCLVCGATDEYTVKAPGHAYQNGVCLVCGERLELGFTDVKTSAYYYPAVLWAVERGVTTGTSADTFSPGTDCTRGQVVTFLWRAAGEPSPADGDAMPFGDVKKSAYYYRAVLWAVENGVTSGTAPGQFSPNDTCTRGQVVTFLWRASGQPEPTATGHPFTDVKPTAYYQKAVLWAVEQGVTTGVSDVSFDPSGSCTRAQVVTFLYRAHQREIDLR